MVFYTTHDIETVFDKLETITITNEENSKNHFSISSHHTISICIKVF
jgi:hypothetical protein